jgi:hypothetical protein
MKTLFGLLVIAFLATSCATNRVVAVRPLIITNKVYIYTERGIARYEFKDAAGKKFEFYGNDDRYNVGDNIDKP